MKPVISKRYGSYCARLVRDCARLVRGYADIGITWECQEYYFLDQYFYEVGHYG